MSMPEDVVFILGKGGKRRVKGGGKCWGACLNRRRGGGGTKKTVKKEGVIKRLYEHVRNKRDIKTYKPASRDSAGNTAYAHKKGKGSIVKGADGQHYAAAKNKKGETVVTKTATADEALKAIRKTRKSK
jgi:hypothetical protein